MQVLRRLNMEGNEVGAVGGKDDRRVGIRSPRTSGKGPGQQEFTRKLGWAKADLRTNAPTQSWHP